ncbi:MAG: cysteine desulfurase [Planctomycetaceae bacterium]|nr:cysteine desulfurase [Planctomycetaceae bacterium]
MIYLDNHATTCVAPEVLAAMLPYFTEQYGNAASVNHAFGWRAAEAVERAREQIARLLNCPADWIVFTSGATEANNLAIKGVFTATMPRRRDEALRPPHFITNAAEHPSVLDIAKRLKRQGIDVTILPVNRCARVDPQQVADAIRPETVLVSVMLANNEVGTINPLTEISCICRDRGVLLHCDAVQVVGKIPVDLQQLPVDLVSLSAHKFHGPKGVGALVVRRDGPRIPLEPLFDGGGHEQHLRSGTLPVPLVVGFGAACELTKQTRSASEGVAGIDVRDDSPSLALRVCEADTSSIATLRDRLWQRLQSELDGLSLNGPPLSERLSNNLNFSVAGVDGEALMSSLKKIAVSSGSACSTAEPEPSHVLRAIGVSDSLSRASLRFGLSRYTTEAEIDIAVAEVVQVVRTLRP